MNSLIVDTPIGPLQLISQDGFLLELRFQGQHREDCKQTADDTCLKSAAQQLEEYFAGKRQYFDLPLAPAGSVFQQQVWRALQQIPYGELRSYRDIACSIGNEKAVRAVGRANGCNPLPIIVPCHRVIGSDGKLTGFSGGLETKSRLLALEAAQLTAT
ncbi:methylated-DNA--[protein]-cysteine S-methyltransferase [Sediminihaliea albiluteola]|uniref:methylated-DNA--[protein]-cysteine S-methyltransferase n=1 Tax=Sediminihaliea albiluteola TaxID=2758564 RepID=UPI002E292EA1|nr:methylated-DNA--[protein]-cysteine S-methyltransferase [Sediminihaliea albiluteola]